MFLTSLCDAGWVVVVVVSLQKHSCYQNERGVLYLAWQIAPLQSVAIRRE
jgi:hypothetical protein